MKNSSCFKPIATFYIIWLVFKISQTLKKLQYYYFAQEQRICVSSLHIITSKMKLITHNMLTSKCMKGVTTGYPLTINATNVKVIQVDFNPEFISRVIPKLDWEVLWGAANSIGHSEGLPRTIEPKYEEDEEFLKKAHKVLLEVEVEEGHLTCPETGRQFPISKGIPNMLLTEAEVQ